jgi:hypothetical protein
MRAARTRAIRLKSQYAHYHRMDHVSWSGVSALCAAATLFVVLLTLFSRFRTSVSAHRFSARWSRTISGMSTSSVARRPHSCAARPRLRCNRPFRTCNRATAPRFWLQHLPRTCMCVTATPFDPPAQASAAPPASPAVCDAPPAALQASPATVPGLVAVNYHFTRRWVTTWVGRAWGAASHVPVGVSAAVTAAHTSTGAAAAAGPPHMRRGPSADDPSSRTLACCPACEGHPPSGSLRHVPPWV